jgi:hypothetical protein
MPGTCLLALLNNLQTGVSQHHQLDWKAQSAMVAMVFILNRICVMSVSPAVYSASGAHLC